MMICESPLVLATMDSIQEKMFAVKHYSHKIATSPLYFSVFRQIPSK